jgi:methyl-accepting chemotaxis protein
MSLTIAKRLWVGFGLVLALMGVMAFMGWTIGSRGLKSSSDLATIANQLKNQSLLVNVVDDLRFEVENFQTTPTDENRERVASQRKQVDTDYASTETSLQSDTAKSLLKDSRPNLEGFDNVFAEMLDALKTRDASLAAMREAGNRALSGLKTTEEIAGRTNNAELNSAVNKIAATYMSARLESRQFTFTRDEQTAASVRKIKGEIVELFKDAGTTVKTPEQGQALAEANAGFEAWKQAFDKVAEANAALVSAENRTNQNLLAAAGQFDKLRDYLSKESVAVQDSAKGAIQASRWTGLVLAGIAFAVGLAASFWIARSITTPLKALTDRLKDIAQGEGDLTQRVDQDRKDELGELGKWFNTFVAKIHDVVVEVGKAANEVASAATEIAASNEEMAAAVEEMSRQAGEASNKASESGKTAEEGGSVVGETIAGMQAINDSSSKSAASVGDLFKQSEQIGAVISVINDIADQTNLLALNAAIEAARAGEHGRGFAVVADEVRKLAERTTTATEEVSGSIKSIQGKTQEAVEIIKDGQGKAAKGAEHATAAGGHLEQIVGSAKSVASLIEQIAAASHEVGAGVSQSATASTELSNKAEQLRELVGRFKTTASQNAAARKAAAKSVARAAREAAAAAA